jgi:hypothetical protein
MAHFYGRVSGNRGDSTRLGSKASGIVTYAASDDGAVQVSLWHDRRTGRDTVEIKAGSWNGRHLGVPCVLLYRGAVEDLERYALLPTGGIREGREADAPDCTTAAQRRAWVKGWNAARDAMLAGNAPAIRQGPEFSPADASADTHRTSEGR